MRIVVYGSREFGRVVRNIVSESGHEFAGFVDDIYSGPDVIGGWSACRAMIDPSEYEVAIGIGYADLAARWRVFGNVQSDGFRCATLVHPSASISKKATIGEGSIVMTRCVVDCAVAIGRGSVIWPGVVVSHDSVIEDNVFLSPNATVCGSCRVGHSSFVGAGAVIVDHVVVPPKSFIRAGRVFSERAADLK